MNHFFIYELFFYIRIIFLYTNHFFKSIIYMNKENIIKLVSLLAIISIIIVSIFNSAIKDGKFICNRYILNSYLYILLVLVIIVLQILFIDDRKINVLEIYKHFSGLFGFILLLILVIGTLMVLMYIPPKYMFIKHIVFILFSLVLGLLAYPSYIKSKKENI